MDLTPLLPQIITAVAALGGVVLTLIFTGRREGKRVEQQLTFEREKLLADERRQLFIRTSHALQRMREHLKYERDEVLEHGPQAWEEAVTKCADQLFMIETELRLLAPALATPVRAATKVARLVRDAPKKFADDVREELMLRYQTNVDSTMSQMQAVLGSEVTSRILPPARERFWRHAPGPKA